MTAMRRRRARNLSAKVVDGIPVALGQAKLHARRIARSRRGEDRDRELQALLDERRPGVPVGDTACIVFSKDRAMQLDACLRSIEMRAPYRGQISVVYRATSQAFERAYDQVETGERVSLVAQSDFRDDVLKLLDHPSPYTVFHTDDDIFFRSAPSEAVPLPEFAAFSLRLGENTTFSYPLDRAQPIPHAVHENDVMAWDWLFANDDFAYPMSVNGHVFETSFIRDVVRRSAFSNPNELEHQLHLHRYLAPPAMLAFRRSCVVSLPVNAVSDTRNRRGGDTAYTAQALNSLFLRGARMDFESMDFSAIDAAHQEIPLVVRRGE